MPQPRRISDPKCRHKRKGTVEAGDRINGPHAMTSVCDRTPCIEDAMQWARLVTYQEPTFVLDVDRDKQP